MSDVTSLPQTEMPTENPDIVEIGLERTTKNRRYMAEHPVRCP